MTTPSPPSSIRSISTTSSPAAAATSVRSSIGPTSFPSANSSASPSPGSFWKKPAIAFLDEASSALGEENERFLYEKLRAFGIAFVGVGHRSTLKEFHDRLLLLKNDGTSEIVPLPKTRTEPASRDS